MKQFNLFGDEIIDNNEYTHKISGPIYKPKNKKPHILELLDKTKANRLIIEIKNSNISIEEKEFLIEAAKRHNKFNYSKIADYYAHASKEMQELMEHSALIIIDFNKALQYGYVKLADEIANLYIEDYE